MNAAEFVTRLQKYFYRETPSSDFLATVRDYVERKNGSYLKQLLTLVINTCRFFPGVAEIREIQNRISVPAPLALSEPLPSDQEIKENLEIIAELKEKYQVTDNEKAGNLILGSLLGLDDKDKMAEVKRELERMKKVKADKSLYLVKPKKAV